MFNNEEIHYNCIQICKVVWIRSTILGDITRFWREIKKNVYKSLYNMVFPEKFLRFSNFCL